MRYITVYVQIDYELCRFNSFESVLTSSIHHTSRNHTPLNYIIPKTIILSSSIIVFVQVTYQSPLRELIWGRALKSYIHSPYFIQKHMTSHTYIISPIRMAIVSHVDICKNELHGTSVIKLTDLNGDLFTFEKQVLWSFEP